MLFKLQISNDLFVQVKCIVKVNQMPWKIRPTKTKGLIQ